MKRRSILSVTLALTLGFGGLFTSTSEVSASTLSDLQKEKNNIINERSGVNQSIKEKDSKINHLEHQQRDVEAEMRKLESEIAKTDNQIKEKEQEIEDTKAEINTLKAEIKELKERIRQRNELLKERARNIQINGGSVKYLDVLLGAESFGDFIDRISAVTTLVKADQVIIEEQIADQEKLEAAQKKVEDKLASLNGMLEELEGLKADLSAQNAQKKKLAKELAAEKKHVEGEKLALKEEEQILAAQSVAIEQAIKLEEKRIAEEAARKAREEAERKAREEEERKAREAAAAAKNATQSNASSSNNSVASAPSAPSKSNNSVSTPAVTSGYFMRPSNGYVSSEYGYRARFGSMHHGIDIAASGTVPIVAAANGVVSQSYHSPSYGNVVFISHSYNGKTYTTVYAHLSSRNISAGATVSKGQLIGYMGNTGHSFGQHLHFEFHEGPWNNSKSNAVNPRRHINF